jgi:type II secretory pathway component PulJ
MQVLIAIPIVAMISMAIATMISQLAKQNRQISQKLDTLELKQQITPFISEDTNCTGMLVGTLVDPAANPAASLSVLKTSATGAVFVTANAPLPGSYSGVRVSTIELRDFVATGNLREYNMTLRISWDPSTLVMALQPIAYPKVVTLDDKNKITSCHQVPSGPSVGPCTQKIFSVGNGCTQTGGRTPTINCECDSGQHPVWCTYSYTTRTGFGKNVTTTTHSGLGTLTATGCTATGVSNAAIQMSCCL